MPRLFRSIIFVPGNNPRFLEKAKTLKADIVCLDLEDSVPRPQKQDARLLVCKALESREEYGSSVFVRTNPPASEDIRDDIRQAVQPGIDGLVIPKVNAADEIASLEGLLAESEKKAGIKPVEIMASIESARGVVNTYAIASARRVSCVVFGVFDLLNDMKIEYAKGSPGAAYSRARIPVDARAAGVPAIDAIWQDLRDPDGLVSDCKIARDLGYSGKSIIHPDQIDTVHETFWPTEPEIAWARRVRDAYEESSREGRGATAIDGLMIDEVHYKQATALLELAETRP